VRKDPQNTRSRPHHRLRQPSAIELLKLDAGLDTLVISYRAAPALTDLSGQTHLLAGSMLSSLPLAQERKDQGARPHQLKRAPAARSSDHRGRA
jgi:hypothetical protein